MQVWMNKWFNENELINADFNIRIALVNSFHHSEIYMAKPRGTKANYIKTLVKQEN